MSERGMEPSEIGTNMLVNYREIITDKGMIMKYGDGIVGEGKIKEK